MLNSPKNSQFTVRELHRKSAYISTSSACDKSAAVQHFPLSNAIYGLLCYRATSTSRRET